MNLSTIRINQTEIGLGQPAYIVAELSGNHNGDLGRALETIRAAAAAGVNAIKLQTYTPETITIRCNTEDFIVGGDGPWSGRSLYDLYQEAHTPYEWHPALFQEGRRAGLDVFSTPFDSTAVDLLENLGAPAYKIASFEIIDDALLRYVARTGKPVIFSTGMATVEEIVHAVATLRSAGCREMVALRCTSSYPAPDDSMNLRSIPRLADITGCLVGLSDHSLGTTAPVVAVTIGACLIEKHFTLSRADGGVDSGFSLEPEELRQLVRDVRRAEAMLGDVKFGPGAAEEGNLSFRRSLYVVKDIASGETLTHENVRSIRPGFGLSPRYIDLVIGRAAKHDLRRGTPLRWESVG